MSSASHDAGERSFTAQSIHSTYSAADNASMDGLLPQSPDSSSEGHYANPNNPGFGGAGVGVGVGTGSAPGARISSRPKYAQSPTSFGSPRWANSPPASVLSSAHASPRGSDDPAWAAGRFSSLRGSSKSVDMSAGGISGVRHRSTPSSNMAHSAYTLPTTPAGWADIKNAPEPDDALHDPRIDSGKSPAMSVRGMLNIGTLVVLGCGLLGLFAGYPVVSYALGPHISTKGGFNLGGTNASGQVADIKGMRTSLIDPDTPQGALTRIGLDGTTEFELVFSDEFETAGRSFYPGDDPFWEAVDLHYWGTNNYEWYDPAAVTTSDGALQITLSETPEHNLNFRGGMLQSWNKMCFTGGYLAASVRMPGRADVGGLWPAFWAMGNLGRAGYGASLEGNWPYTYDTCDVGTLQNQTYTNSTPVAALTGGDTVFNRKHGTNALSFLTGQRLSACTCPDDDHPGPKLPDGTWQGRSAPEIDVFESQVENGKMTVSQSAQAAPFNLLYTPSNASGPAFSFYQKSTKHNGYTGEVTQQALSAVTVTPQGAMQYGGDGSFAEYGFEYQAGHGGYIEWVSGGEKAWRLNAAALEADPQSGISDRPVPQEPMYIILNLGMSSNFGTVDWEGLADLWPAVMSVDWVRVYQPKGQINVGCDPPDFPTSAYIERHMPAYTNANLTLWGNTQPEGGYEQDWPRNRLNPGGCDAEPSKKPGSPSTPKPRAPALKQHQIAIGQ